MEREEARTDVAFGVKLSSPRDAVLTRLEDIGNDSAMTFLFSSLREIIKCLIIGAVCQAAGFLNSLCSSWPRGEAVWGVVCFRGNSHASVC